LLVLFFVDGAGFRVPRRTIIMTCQSSLRLPPVWRFRRYARNTARRNRDEASNRPAGEAETASPGA
jgi:hypothetical protein